MYVLRHNNGKEHDPLLPVLSVIPRFSTKSIVFQKTFLNFLRCKLHHYIFEELSNLYPIVLLISFFPLHSWIVVENRTKLKKLLIWTTKSGGTQTLQTYKLHLTISTALVLVTFWTKYDFCIIFYCRNKLKTSERAKRFFNPANAQSSSEKSPKEKRHTVIGLYSLCTRFNIQMLNLCHKWHKRIQNPLKYLRWSVLWK